MDRSHNKAAKANLTDEQILALQKKLFEAEKDQAEKQRSISNLEMKLEGMRTELEKMKKCYSSKVDELTKKLEEGERDVFQKRALLQRYEYTLGELYASASWRITAPLRILYELLLGKRHLLSRLISAINNFISVSGRALPPENNIESKIDLSDHLNPYYGEHRSGWHYAIGGLATLHNPDGIYLDAFIDISFVWAHGGVKPHLRPWIGFIHVPPNVPEWFLFEQSNESIFRSAAWQESVPFCKGLFTLSHYHKNALEQKFDLPIENLLLPTETPKNTWTFDKFINNREKKIVQVGWWLRKLHTIFLLKTEKYKKVFLRVKHIRELDGLFETERNLLKEQGLFDETCYGTAQTIDFLSNHDYDQLLSENIPILNLYDTSANNAIVECIVRNTPILVNPLKAVVEYLGKDYPLYFTSLDEATEKAEDFDLIRATHKYLTEYPLKEKLTAEYFRKSFVESQIYKKL